MRVPLSWLLEFAPLEADAEAIAELLTSRGLKVEGIERPWAGLDGVIVARVVDKRPHPDSDRLTLARLDTGNGEGHVVAGVANWQVGDLVSYAPPGSRVPLLPEPLGVRTLRGERSEGMICSPKELAISADHGGILILPADLAPGTSVKDALGLDEVVYDVEIKANRADLLSIVGVAREAAAVAGVPMRRPDTSVEESGEPAASVATVEIHDLERCPRYLARVIAGVTVGPSPLGVQARLTAAGMRPLSNVVDATNYVMLEMGQPLHAFDMDRLAGPGIVVRAATERELLVTLDDQERVLAPTDLVIADLEQGVAIAGIMGSAAAEVGDATANVLLEAAHFDRRSVIRTSRRLDLRTEASARFERGIDPEGVAAAAARAAALIQAWSGGAVRRGTAEAGAVPERRHLVVRPARVSLILGQPVSAAEITESLGRIEIPAVADASGAGAGVDVEVPGFRVDVEREIDVIEEIIRVLGYDRVGATTPAVRQAGGVPATYDRRRTIRRALAAAGFREIESYSFASAADLELLAEQEDAAVRVRNPLLADEAFLRTSLIPGLLRALRLNASRQVRGAALFEVGHVFHAAAAAAGDENEDRGERAGAGPSERESVAGALFGHVGPALHERREVDVFDAKGAVDAVLEPFGIHDWEVVDTNQPHPFHPGRAGAVAVDGRRIGRFGELHPSVGSAFDLPGRVAAFEVDVEALAETAGPEGAYRDVPRFPPARRDLAFVVDAGVPVGEIQRSFRRWSESVGNVELFDLYEGPPIPAGKRNVAFSLEFRAPDRTLTDDDVARVVDELAERVRSTFGGELRSS
jgi:phenylalanyl-tRNA synthetase beta chain